MAKFKHIIPLGFFCGTARELERFGFRSRSYPFDWQISHSFASILYLLENGFPDFLNADAMSKEGDTNRYYNSITDIHFYHDFTPTGELAPQLPAVKAKYERRIERLYNDMKEPTLFVRYCFDAEEEKFYEENSSRIEAFVKKGNPENKILFIRSSDTARLENVEPWRIDAYIAQPRGSYSGSFVKTVPGLRKYLADSFEPGRLVILRNRIRFWWSLIKKRLPKLYL